MGLPFEHGLRSTVIAMRLADRLGIDDQTASETCYACLLSHSGCTADAEVLAETFGGALTTHVAPFVTGSQRELVTGLLRALPDPGSSAPLAAMQIALRPPRAARVNQPQDFWTVRPDGRELKQLTHFKDGTLVRSASYSPDGRWIVHASDGIDGQADLFVSPR